MQHLTNITAGRLGPDALVAGGVLLLFFLFWLLFALIIKAGGRTRRLYKVCRHLSTHIAGTNQTEELFPDMPPATQLAMDSYRSLRAYNGCPAAAYFSPGRLFPGWKTPGGIVRDLPLFAAALFFAWQILPPYLPLPEGFALTPAAPFAAFLAGVCLVLTLVAAWCWRAHKTSFLRSYTLLVHLMDSLPLPEKEGRGSAEDLQRQDADYIQAYKELAASNFSTQLQMRDALRALIAELSLSVKDQRAVNAHLEKLTGGMRERP